MDTLDFGEAATAEMDAARRRPCAGECGKLYTNGGTLYLSPARWYCDDCDTRINGEAPECSPPEAT